MYIYICLYIYIERERYIYTYSHDLHGLACINLHPLPNVVCGRDPCLYGEQGIQYGIFTCSWEHGNVWIFDANFRCKLSMQTFDSNFLPVFPRFSTRVSWNLLAQHAQAAGAVLSQKFNTSMLSTTMCMSWPIRLQSCVCRGLVLSVTHIVLSAHGEVDPTRMIAPFMRFGTSGRFQNVMYWTDTVYEASKV